MTKDELLKRIDCMKTQEALSRKDNDINLADALALSIANATKKLLAMQDEKKNEQSETAGEQPKPSAEPIEEPNSTAKSIVIPIDSADSGDNSDMGDELKFSNAEDFDKFHDLKMKVHTELVNWVARKTPKTELEKRKKYAAVEYWCSLAIDQVMRTAKYEYQKMILEKEFSITFRDKTKDVYTLDVEQLSKKYDFKF